MKTKKCKFVLLESKNNNDRTYPCILKQINGILGYYSCNIKTPTTAMELILISLEDEKIEEGDNIYEKNLNIEQSCYKVYKRNCELGFVWIPFSEQNSVKKVIATQEQISPEDIQKAIEYYNANGEFEDVEVKMVENIHNLYSGSNAQWVEEKPKLTNGFVTIVEPKKYPIGGYAPGNYRCKCANCGCSFQGDKRACQCESCATKML